LWGSKSSRFKDWQEGDSLAFIVNKSLAALATVAGKPFHSTEVIWDNGLFPYRIPIKFVHVLRKDKRVPILGKVRETLTSAWGPKYGWGILNQQVLEDTQAENLIKAITSHPNSLTQIEADLATLLSGAKQEREVLSKQKKPIEKMPKEKRGLPSIPKHNEIRDMLFEIGKIEGKISEVEYPIDNLRLDVVWKTITSGNPKWAFEVQMAGNFYEALTKLKHAWDKWNSKPFLITTNAYITQAKSLLEGSFHEMKDDARIVNWEKIVKLHELLDKAHKIKSEIRF